MAKIIGAGEICRRMMLSEATVMGLIQSDVLLADRNDNNEWETTDQALASAKGVYSTGKKAKSKIPPKKTIKRTV